MANADPNSFNYVNGASRFHDPFIMDSNLYIPQDFYTALEFARYLAVKNPVYTSAIKRTVSHFLTKVVFVGKTGDKRERDELSSYLEDTLDIMGALQQAGMEMYIYGNSFWRIHYPFDRYLIDRRNGGYKMIAVTAFRENDIRFNLENMTYNVPDPQQADRPPDMRDRVDFEFMDRKSHDASRIKLMPIDPVRMMINMNWVSGKCQYVWRFEEFFTSAVRRGTPIHQINDTPIDMLKAIRANQDFAFNDGTIFHFKNPFISGISNNGWGIPGAILNYHSFHQIQVLRCINESIGLDYMLPFRIISPNAGPAGSDGASMSTNFGVWNAAVSQLIKRYRKDQKSIHATPVPLNYQEFNGNGKALAPVELIKFYENEQLNGADVPAELYNMTLAVQQLPTGVRIFESTHTHWYRKANNFLRWVTKNVLNYQEKEQIGVRLQPPSVADDLERRHILLQLAAGGEVSRATAYQAFNIMDPVEESIRRTQEDIEIQKAKDKESKKFEREAQLGSANQVVAAMMEGQAGPGGVAPGGPPMAPPPAGGGPQQGTTPLDIEQQGAEQAMQLLQIDDVGQRRKLMMQIKASNPVLYAVVQRKMEDMRQQGASEGRKMVGKQ